MNIGILGSAEVGQALGHGFLSEGYQVMLGTRDTSKEDVVKWKTAHPGSATGWRSANSDDHVRRRAAFPSTLCVRIGALADDYAGA